MNQQLPDKDLGEIDLNQLTQKIGKSIGNFGYFIFNSIQFFIKHGIAIVLLLILGLAAGFYLSSVQKKYDHKIIVLPNFNSTEYLYNKINLLNIKIEDKDTVFLKSIGIKYPEKLREIKIEAIIDPYDFVNGKESNMEMLKLIAEDGSMEKVVKDEMTSMKYEYHQILIISKDKINRENTVDPLMNFLNNNSYFTLIQKNEVENLKNKIKYTEQTLNQVNGILDNFSNGDNKYGSDSKLMYYNNENSEIDNVLKTKSTLVSELGYYKLELVNTEKIIRELSIVDNVQREATIPVMLPALFVGLYIFIVFFIGFYKKQKTRQRSEITA
ncbi:hypothetical protein [Flavobacterium tegetincola]|uniref:hypothetical protein n=1 Tax=Flavobacterium tegetincola TaxID=150172 RepID=UPI000403F277|nr:hypothetical protein [Flavobacterium tegetincola]